MFEREVVACWVCGSAKTDGRTIREQNHLHHYRLTGRRATCDRVNCNNLNNTWRLDTNDQHRCIVPAKGSPKHSVEPGRNQLAFHSQAWMLGQILPAGLLNRYATLIRKSYAKKAHIRIVDILRVAALFMRAGDPSQDRRR